MSAPRGIFVGLVLSLAFWIIAVDVYLAVTR